MQAHFGNPNTVHSWPHAWRSLQGTPIGLWLPSFGYIDPSHQNADVSFLASPTIILINLIPTGSRITKHLFHRSSHSSFQKMVSLSFTLIAHLVGNTTPIYFKNWYWKSLRPEWIPSGLHELLLFVLSICPIFLILTFLFLIFFFQLAVWLGAKTGNSIFFCTVKTDVKHWFSISVLALTCLFISLASILFLVSTGWESLKKLSAAGF